MARLDRLAPVKEVAQIGAVIGREFSYELLVAVADRRKTSCGASTSWSIRADLPPQRAARGDLQLQARAGAGCRLPEPAQVPPPATARPHRGVLEERFPEAVRGSRSCWRTTARRRGSPRRRSNTGTGGASGRARAASGSGRPLRQGLELLETLPDPSARQEREIDLQIALGGALIAAKGQAAPETGRAYARAHELCGRFGDPGRLFPVLFGRWVFHLVRAEHAAAQDIAEELLRSAERDGTQPAWSSATVRSGSARSGGVSWSKRAGIWSGRSPVRSRAAPVPRLHLCLRSAARGPGWAGFRPVSAGLSGPSRRALPRGGRRRRAAIASHRLGLRPAPRVHVGPGPPGRSGVRQRAAALVALAAEHGFALWQAAARCSTAGRSPSGAERRRDRADRRRARRLPGDGWGLFVPYFLALLGTTHGAAGGAAEGQRLLAEALDAGRASGERWFEAELHRLKGELLLRPVAIEPRRKLASQRHGRRPRAAKLVGAARRDQPRPAVAGAGPARRGLRACSRPVYGWFTEGFDTQNKKKKDRKLSITDRRRHEC